MPPDAERDPLHLDLLDDMDPDGDDVYDDIPPPFPVAYRREGHDVPDMSLLPREEWEEVLRWCAPRARELAVHTTGTHEDAVAVQWILVTLRAEQHARTRRALRESAPPPAPPLPARRDEQRQVNFRLSAEQYAELDRVARSYGVSCPRLAMMLTMRGVSRALGDP